VVVVESLAKSLSCFDIYFLMGNPAKYLNLPTLIYQPLHMLINSNFIQSVLLFLCNQRSGLSALLPVLPFEKHFVLEFID